MWQEINYFFLDCDVVVPGDATVSRKHAVISITKDQQVTIVVFAK